MKPDSFIVHPPHLQVLQFPLVLLSEERISIQILNLFTWLEIPSTALLDVLDVFPHVLHRGRFHFWLQSSLIRPSLAQYPCQTLFYLE